MHATHHHIACASLPAPPAEVGSQYEEDGTLTAQLSNFVEVRCLQPAPGGGSGGGNSSGQQAPAEGPPKLPTAAAKPSADAGTAARGAASAAAGLGAPAVQAAPAEDLGPSRYSQLGPPRPAAKRGDVIVPEGGWASLYEQLQQRRSQLVRQQEQEQQACTPSAAAAQVPSNAGGSEVRVQSAPPAAAPRNRSGSEVNGASHKGGSLTPGSGATRPRAGVRRTALGPMLRLLREAEELA